MTIIEPWMIEELEKEQIIEETRPRLYLPIDEPEEYEEKKKEDSDRGVITINL